MNEREKTEELLREMGEVHRRHESGADENALLLRALERKPRRPVWALAGWLVAALVVIGIVLKPILPAMGGKATNEYAVSQAKVRVFRSDNEYWGGTYYRCSWEGKEFFIARQNETHPENPLVAFVRLADAVCFLYPVDTSLAQFESGKARELQPLLDSIKAVSTQMNKAKLWPAGLWGIKPLVNKLELGGYRLVFFDPASSSNVVVSGLHAGDETGCLIRGQGLRPVATESTDFIPLKLYVWPDSFTLRAHEGKYSMYLTGDGRGYDAYQMAEWWGEGVRKNLTRIKEHLPQCTRLLPMLGDSVPPALLHKLRQTTDQIVANEPRALYHADESKLSHRMEPWRPVGLSQLEQERQKEDLAALKPELSLEWNGLRASSRENKEVLSIERNGLKLSFFPRNGGYAEASVSENGKSLPVEFYMLNEDRLPVLRSELTRHSEELLGKLSVMAQDALRIPAEQWPGGGFPGKVARNWLEALAERQVAVRESLGNAMLMTTIERDGDGWGLVITVRGTHSAELNLRLRSDGFDLLNVSAGYLVSMSDGKASAARTADAAPAALPDEDARQLETAISLLSDTAEGILSAVQPGIEQFRSLLKHPEAAQVEVVDELPEVPWAGEAMINRYIQVLFGMQSLKDAP